ncbi:unnamed protein product, partial [marine sediment metagenome]
NLVHELGYNLYDVATNPDLLFKEIATKNKMDAIKVGGEWKYIDKESKKEIFTCKQKDKPRIDEETYNVQYEDIHNSGWSGRHVSNAFYIELEEKLGVKIKQTSLLPDLHLSDEEKKWISQVEQEFNYRGKFWLINSGHKKDYPLKQWGFDRWQKLVYLLKDKIQFVQVGELGDNHIHKELDGALNNKSGFVATSYRLYPNSCTKLFALGMILTLSAICFLFTNGLDSNMAGQHVRIVM